MTKPFTFNIVTPAYFGESQLSLMVLQSYILSKDRTMDIRLNRFFTEDDTGNICEKIAGQHPSAACFSLYAWTDKKVKEVCYRLKELDDDILIIIGGNVPTFQAKELLETVSCYDIAVIGEGEETLFQLLTAIRKGNRDFSAIDNIAFRENGSVRVTQRRENYNIEEQYFPLYLEDSKDVSVIFYETSRGCFNKCRYCAYNMNFDAQNIVRFYPLEKVEKDLENLFNLPNLKRLDFSDASIVFRAKGKRDRGLRILRLMNSLNNERKKKNWPLLEIGVDVNLESVDDEILHELKVMNTFAYGFGLQTIHPDVHKLSLRGFNEKKFTYYFNRLAEKSGAAVNLELMFGLPGDTYEKFLDSVEYVISKLKVHFLVCFRFAVLPGSMFRKHQKEFQLHCQDYPPYYLLSIPTFPPQDLEKAERLSFFIQLIFTLFRGIKKLIEKSNVPRKVDVYLGITRMISEKYSDFFPPEGLLQGDVYDYVNKLRQSVNTRLRQGMQADMRKFVNSYQKQQQMVKHQDQTPEV
ncbi:MAG: cobalamin-dependent protein [Candidatus Aminicenantes bacterium]|nr:MAG: cobalamin-dependent protein [Candidatus Aminicenantes bacterium]